MRKNLSSVGIAGTLVATVLATGASATAAHPAVPPRPEAGPKLYDNCFWAGPRGKGLGGGIHVADNYPDAGATYWFAKVHLPAGSKLQLDGAFPHARYMAYSTYDGKLPVGSLHDAQLTPAAGSTNPYRSGARRDGTARSYSVDVLPQAAPAGAPPNNTFFVGTDPEVSLVYRVYLPDRGADVAGGVPLPAVTLVQADGTRLTGAAACAAINAPDRGLQTAPPLSVSQWSDLLHSPGQDPATAPARRAPVFERFFNAAYNFLGDFRPETRTTKTPPDNGGAYSNADSRYLYVPLSRRFGKVVVLRGKLPTTPATVSGDRRMGDGQLRYWSMCTNKTPVSGASVACVADEQVPLRGDRRYTIVVSRPDDRPRDATTRCGVAWLDWGTQTEAPQDPDYGLLIMRNMLPSPGFHHAVQDVAAFGAERSVMGSYDPTAAYTTKARFERRGCDR